jgi:hypothetical protein
MQREREPKVVVIDRPYEPPVIEREPTPPPKIVYVDRPRSPQVTYVTRPQTPPPPPRQVRVQLPYDVNHRITLNNARTQGP